MPKSKYKKKHLQKINKYKYIWKIPSYWYSTFCPIFIIIIICIYFYSEEINI